MTQSQPQDAGVPFDLVQLLEERGEALRAPALCPLNVQEDGPPEESKVLRAIDEVRDSVLNCCPQNAPAYRALIRIRLTLQEALMVVRRLRSAQTVRNGYEYSVMLEPHVDDVNYVLFRRVLAGTGPRSELGHGFV